MNIPPIPSGDGVYLCPLKRAPLDPGLSPWVYLILDKTVYKKVIHESTDEYSEEGTICFFPTNKQTLYFKILEISA